MTDNEIIKALECFIRDEGCKGCPFIGTAREFCEDVLNLINQKNARIEELEQENKEYCEANRIIAYQRNQKDKEIQALHRQLNGLNFMEEQIRSEVITEFEDRLLRYTYGELNNMIHFTTNELKKIVKEMKKGELKNEKT